MNQYLKYFAKQNFITRNKQRGISAFYDLDDNKLLDQYNALFLKIFRHAFTHSPFYKTLYLEHGITLKDITDFTDITKLPIIDRFSIKSKVEQIYNGPELFKIKGLTSGTSGTPLTVYRTPINIATEQAYVNNYRSQHGFKKGQPLVSIRGVLGKSTPFEYYKKANILYISSPNINESTIDMYYKMVKEFGPVAIEAFPSYLYKFCIELEKKGLYLDIPRSFTSSETLYDFQREKIEATLKTNIFDWYGNVERSIGLVQDTQLKYKPLPLYSINEYRDDCVITTALTNQYFPLIRYQVNDEIIVTSKDFLQNQISPDIQSIEGRIGDNIDLKDGGVVGCMDHVFKGVSYIENAQIHQYSLDEPVDFKIVASRGYNNSHEQQLRLNIERMLGNDAAIKFTYCKLEDLTLTGDNQKYKLIIKNKPIK
jgi:phenylacetate-CoA ligase